MNKTKPAPQKNDTDWGESLRHYVDVRIHGWKLQPGDPCTALCGKKSHLEPPRNGPLCVVCEDIWESIKGTV